MKKIKLGIIGIGNMGSAHARCVFGGECPDFELVAVADIKPQRLEWAKSELSPDIHCFETAEEMLDSGFINACMVCVPHYDHPKYAIECMRRGIHVMVEKPAGVYTKQVREMNEEAKKHPEVVFGMMFNQRTNCIYRKMRELVQSGVYGNIRRTNWIITNWYRPQAYYDSGDWRATWSGEGGGVLLNQCPHQLDLWQWICGMPKKVEAHLHYGMWHNIEVEDDVTTYVEYENGATGVFITSTGDCPGTNRLEITGTRGKIVLENGLLKLWKLNEDERDICKNATEGFVSPETEYSEFSAEREEAHAGILKNFAGAILHGEELLSPGYDGINELMISNAAYLSQWTGNSRIPLPFDTAEFDRLLKEKQKSSEIKEKTVKNSTDKSCGERWQINW